MVNGFYSPRDWGKVRNGKTQLNPNRDVDKSESGSLFIEFPTALNYIKFLSCAHTNRIICHVSPYAS